MININLLPWREKKQKKIQLLQLRLFYFFCISSIIVFFFLYTYIITINHEKETKIKKLHHQYDDIKSTTEQYQNLKQQVKENTIMINTWYELHDEKIAYTQFLYALSLLIKQNIYIEKIEYDRFHEFIIIGKVLTTEILLSLVEQLKIREEVNYAKIHYLYDEYNQKKDMISFQLSIGITLSTLHGHLK